MERSETWMETLRDSVTGDMRDGVKEWDWDKRDETREEVGRGKEKAEEIEKE